MAKGAKTGGRQKGSKNKTTIERETGRAEIAAKAAAEGISPLEVMLENMRFAHEQSGEILAKIIASEEGESVDTLKELLNFRKLAQSCATDAAPYIHPRKAAVEHTGKDGKDLIPDKVATAFELARFMAFTLEQAAEQKTLTALPAQA